MEILNSFGFLTEQTIIIVGIVIFVLFGGSKIPQLMRGLGRGMGEFQAGINEGKDALNNSLKGKTDDTRTIGTKREDEDPALTAKTTETI